MKEIISIGIGGCGIGISSSVWELYCAEHGLSDDSGIRNINPSGHEVLSNPDIVFEESILGRHLPRQVMLDLGTDDIDKVRSGSQRGLFEQSTMIATEEESGGNFGRVQNFVGRLITD
jgi:tubulin alpha